MGTTINIKPGKFRIPVVVPRSGIDAISVMGLDNRKKYIYSGLIVADTIDGYIPVSYTHLTLPTILRV